MSENLPAKSEFLFTLKTAAQDLNVETMEV